MEETEREEAMGVRRPMDRWEGVPGLEARGEARRGVEGVDRLWAEKGRTKEREGVSSSVSFPFRFASTRVEEGAR